MMFHADAISLIFLFLFGLRCWYDADDFAMMPLMPPLFRFFWYCCCISFLSAAADALRFRRYLLMPFRCHAAFFFFFSFLALIFWYFMIHYFRFLPLMIFASIFARFRFDYVSAMISFFAASCLIILCERHACLFARLIYADAALRLRFRYYAFDERGFSCFRYDFRWFLIRFLDMLMPPIMPPRYIISPFRFAIFAMIITLTLTRFFIFRFSLIISSRYDADDAILIFLLICCCWCHMICFRRRCRYAFIDTLSRYWFSFRLPWCRCLRFRHCRFYFAFRFRFIFAILMPLWCRDYADAGFLPLLLLILIFSSIFLFSCCHWYDTPFFFDYFLLIAFSLDMLFRYFDALFAAAFAADDMLFTLLFIIYYAFRYADGYIAILIFLSWYYFAFALMPLFARFRWCWWCRDIIIMLHYFHYYYCFRHFLIIAPCLLMPIIFQDMHISLCCFHWCLRAFASPYCCRCFRHYFAAALMRAFAAPLFLLFDAERISLLRCLLWLCHGDAAIFSRCYAMPPLFFAAALYGPFDALRSSTFWHYACLPLFRFLLHAADMAYMQRYASITRWCFFDAAHERCSDDYTAPWAD